MVLTIEEEINLAGSEYKLYKLREFSTTELRNLYQEYLEEGHIEVCYCIKEIMFERNSNL